MKKETIARTAAKTAVLMALLTLGSKCFGFIREMVMANFFGTSYIVDAYVMSSSILSILFGGLLAAISVAYMPTFSRITEHEGEERGVEFTNQVINLLFMISIVISIIGILFSDQIILILASGFSGETARLASFFVKVLFSYIIFSSTAGILDAFLQYKGSFLPQIISGYFISICSIAAIVISAYTNVYFLAFGILIGNFLRFASIYIISNRRGYRYSPTAKGIGQVKQMLYMVLPVFLGTYVQMINLFVDRTIASRLAEGSIAALNYAALLNGMITGLTIMVLSTIIYPKLAQAYSLKAYDRFGQIVTKGINVAIIIALPCSLGGLLYSNQVIQIIYERGAFDVTSTSMTTSAFFYYVMGLLFIAISEILIKTYYSMGNMKLPMIFAAISVIINIILCLILVRFMLHNGLALATSIAAFVNAGLLYVGMKKKYPHIVLLESKKQILKIFASAVLAVGASYAVYLRLILPAAGIIYMRTVQLGLAVLVAGVFYLALLAAFKVEEVKLIKQIFKRG